MSAPEDGVWRRRETDRPVPAHRAWFLAVGLIDDLDRTIEHMEPMDRADVFYRLEGLFCKWFP